MRSKTAILPYEFEMSLASVTPKNTAVLEPQRTESIIDERSKIRKDTM